MADKEDQTSTSGQEDKGGPRMVPESDLIAVKKGLLKELEEAKAGHTTTLTQMNTQLSEIRQQLLQEQAAKEQLDTQLKSSISQDDMGKVIADRDAAIKRSGELDSKLLDLRRNSMATTYKVPADTLKDRTSDQLDLMEIALKAVGGGQASTKSFDLGGGGGAASPSTPIDRAKEAIAKAMEKRGALRQ